MLTKPPCFPVLCPRHDLHPQWNDFAGCNVKAKTNAAWVTGNNTAVVAAYEACYKIRDPKDCVKAGKVMFDPKVARVSGPGGAPSCAAGPA